MKTLSLALQTLGEMGRFSLFLTLTTQEPLLSPLGREWSLKISLRREVPVPLVSWRSIPTSVVATDLDSPQDPG